MLKITLLAVAAMLLSAASCTSSTKSESVNSSLLKTWKLDSVHTNKDSGLSYILTSIALHHSPKGIRFHFTKDSILTIDNSDTDKVAYQLNEAAHSFRVSEGSKLLTYKYTLSDSVLSIRTSDSAVLYLSKQ